MELKDLLKEGGFSVLSLGLAIYICGWQAYLVFFHNLNMKVNFFVPVENGLGEGLQPVFTAVAVPAVAALLGLLGHVSFLKRFSLRVGIVIACTALTGWGLPFLIEKTTESWMKVTLSHRETVTCGVWAAFLGAWVSVLVLKAVIPPISWQRYLFFLLPAAATLYLSIFVAHVRGRGMGQILERGRWSPARVQFETEDLRHAYSQAIFLPILDLGKDIVFVRYPEDASERGHIVIVRRELVKSVEYVPFQAIEGKSSVQSLPKKPDR